MYRVFFDTDMNLVDWLRQYAQTEEEREFSCVTS
jgi:hypothetical protein